MTPETLPRHELIGLDVRVADAAHEGYVGVSGRVVDETTNTLLIEGVDAGLDVETGRGGAERGVSDTAGAGSVGGRVRRVPKAAATFEFRLPTSDDAPARGASTTDATEQGADAFVTVAGDRLVARPARRTERRGDSIWR